MRLKSATVLRALMDERDMSLSRLARYAGCSRGFVSHLTSGRRTCCRPVLAARIAEALSVPLDVLFTPKVPPVTRRNGSNQAA